MGRRTQAARRPRLVLLALGTVLAAAFLLSFSLGLYGVPPLQVARILLSRLLMLFAPDGGLRRTWTTEMETVVINIRLPRIAMACLVGCSLSAAGAAYQGVFQNPMASPDLLGASSGAAFGAALAAYCDRVFARTKEIAGSVEKRDLLYITGDQGLNVIAQGSYHAEVIDLLGNNLAVVDSPSSKGTGTFFCAGQGAWAKAH